MNAIPYEEIPDQVLEIPFVQLLFVCDALMKKLSPDDADQAYIRFVRTGQRLDVYVGDLRLSDPFQSSEQL